MTTQTAMQFDSATHSPELAQQAKEQGMAQACSPAYRRALLEYARGLAVSIATQRGDVTASDVRNMFIARQGLAQWEHLGNAAGSLFKGPQWRFTGQYVPSGIVSRHGAMVRVWALRDAITGHSSK